MAWKKRELSRGLTEETLAALVADVQTPEGLDDVFHDVKRALVERVLRAELTAHLSYAAGERPEGETNACDGTSAKSVLTDEGKLPLAIPRDRAGTFGLWYSASERRSGRDVLITPKWMQIPNGLATVLEIKPPEALMPMASLAAPSR